MPLVWVDLETTGLDPVKDSILEVAVGYTTHNLFLGPYVIYESVVHTVLSPLHRVDDFVMKMHTKNGLWEACAAGTKSVQTVETELLDVLQGFRQYLTERGFPNEPFIIAGSTIGFDLSFLKNHMPQVAALFSYRLFDVSTIKLFGQSQGMPKLQKGEAHRALADIMESVDHARQVRKWFKG